MIAAARFNGVKPGSEQWSRDGERIQSSSLAENTVWHAWLVHVGGFEDQAPAIGW